jgi:para-nitrobenzyl esterase
MIGRMQQLFGDDAQRVIQTYRKAHPQGTPSQLYIQAWSDHSIMRNTILQAERQAAAGAPVYLYRLDRPSPALGEKLGALHTLEGHYVFDNTEAQKAITGGGPAAAALARSMSNAWVQFAASADPNSASGGLPRWPAYEARKRATMIFDDESRVAEDPTREERAVLPDNDEVSARG